MAEETHPQAGWSRAVVYATDLFVDLAGCASYRTSVVDPLAARIHIAEPVGDERLGEAASRALSSSRNVTVEEMAALKRSAERNWDAWVEGLVRLYEFRSRSRLLGAGDQLKA